MLPVEVLHVTDGPMGCTYAGSGLVFHFRIESFTWGSLVEYLALPEILKRVLNRWCDQWAVLWHETVRVYRRYVACLLYKKGFTYSLNSVTLTQLEKRISMTICTLSCKEVTNG